MDERTREEKKGKTLERWGCTVDIDLTKEDIQEEVRYAFSLGMRNLADKIRIKNDRGAYPYLLPTTIRITTDTSQPLFLRLILSCEVEEATGGMADVGEK